MGDDDLLRAALEASGDVAYAWDFGSDVMTWSSNVQQAFNLNSGTNIATRTEFVCRVNGEDLSTLARVQDGRYEADESYQVEYRLRGDDGTFSWVQDRGVIQGGNDGQSMRAVGTIRVITERKNNEAHLEWLTNFDEVTGHYNRMRLRELLDHAFAYAARYDSPGAYLSVAIDDLAVISDAYGREIADRAVIAVGLALDKCLRGADVVGRVSPDQFGIVISNCPGPILPTVCEKVLEAVLHATVPVAGGALQLTASVGCVSFPQTVHASHDAVIKADVALAYARRNGQNCFVVYNLTEEQRGSRRRTLAIAKEI